MANVYIHRKEELEREQVKHEHQTRQSPLKSSRFILRKQYRYDKREEEEGGAKRGRKFPFFVGGDDVAVKKGGGEQKKELIARPNERSL